jgi:hypothetical protein
MELNIERFLDPSRLIETLGRIAFAAANPEAPSFPSQAVREREWWDLGSARS